MMSIDDQLRILSRRCERVLSEPDLRAKLKKSAATGKPLRIKLGMDPTAPDVTLGHAVPLQVVRQFQDWGHKAVLIIGDYTARVGDPTGRNKTRPQLTGEEIDANAETYVAQVGRILLTRPECLEVRYNGEWLGKMGLVDIIRLASRATVAQMLAREDFANRLASGTEIRLHEILYPLLQGWDSVMIEADVEMGGSDQLFNNLVGREFQKEAGQEGQVVIVTPLLVGTDGVKKMSKSQHNYIALTDPAAGENGVFGKIMSLPDALMESYYTLLTDVSPDEYRPLIESSPRDAKMCLARHIIGWLHSAEAADGAQKAFVQQFVEKQAPEQMPEFTVAVGDHKLIDLLVTAQLAASKGEARRKIAEGGVDVDGQRAADAQASVPVNGEVVLRLGRKYARVKTG
ncbi:MAG TPA: tyrosine--tRNA ligase [Tepidisphaeraceae bacterium]|nr:tyrosine--tRNA ligase [Tepidisphaeraceae bacterium]